MKKLTCFFIVILLMSIILPATAQHRIGIIGGFNFANANVEVERQPAEVANRTLFGVGGVLDLSMNRTFSLRLEPMYLQKGVGKTELAVQPGVEWRAKSSCLELPLLLKAEFGNALRPYVIAGPAVGILLSNKVEAEVSGIVFKGDAKGATKTIDLAATFGAGVRYPIGQNSFFLEGRYSFGLTDTVKDGKFDIVSGPVVEEIEWIEETDKIKNRGLQIMAGVTFPLGRR